MVTPIRQQYLRVKQRYPQDIVFFRLGDFYETFDEDARLVSRELEITLTSRGMGKGQRIPMAGIPYHAVDSYLSRLISKGHKIAICEQLGPAGTGKGLVERDVVRVITPGTVIEPELLQGKSNNYLCSIVVDDKLAGLAYIDITTGEFFTGQLNIDVLPLEIVRLHPSEILMPRNTNFDTLSYPVTRVDDVWFDITTAHEELLEQFGVTTLEGYGCEHLPLAIIAAGAIVHYLSETQNRILAQLTRLATYSTNSYMLLDSQTRHNLELFEGGRNKDPSNSLLAVLDLTHTTMGGRLMKKWLGQPLLDIAGLTQRQDIIAWLCQDTLRRTEIITRLNQVSDLERLANRVKAGLASPKELVALCHTLEQVPLLKEIMTKGGSSCDSPSWLIDKLESCDDIVTLVRQAIVDDPPVNLDKGEIIRGGFSKELDDIRSGAKDARQYLANLEKRERERTGIKSLRVGYNHVFGYYIEVTRANLSQVPENYIRKQTLSNGERYFTLELKEYEAIILNAHDRILELEKNIFRQVCQQAGAVYNKMLTLSATIAEIDVFSALAEIAVRNNYIRPVLNNEKSIVIKGGRHPVVEQTLPAGSFVPNDTYLCNDDTQIIVITGPNMSGKSTYLKQVAIIVLMAQVGSFIPAESATIGIVDRIFTRIGAQEDLTAGQSTFMVEMVETANILNNSTERSLIILDEIGRGTSTYDGISIARAVAEYIHNNPRLGGKTLFATHYHELVDLADSLPRVKNFNVAVLEKDKEVIFLRKIVPGGADRSYGIHVAQLAGLPRPVINRAREILDTLENSNHDNKRRKQYISSAPPQLPLWGQNSSLLDEIAAMDIDTLTPLEAITRLYELRRKVQEDNKW